LFLSEIITGNMCFLKLNSMKAPVIPPCVLQFGETDMQVVSLLDGLAILIMVHALSVCLNPSTASKCKSQELKRSFLLKSLILI
jgi:hypothetical protein